MLVKGYRRMPALGGITYSDNCKKSVIRIGDIRKIEMNEKFIFITTDTVFVGETKELSFLRDSFVIEFEDGDSEADKRIVDVFYKDEFKCHTWGIE